MSNHQSEAGTPAMIISDEPAKVLWCINIYGPDDVIAVGSYLDAVKGASAFNAWWQEYRTKKPLDEQLDARMWAVPVEWPHAAESHAASMAKPTDEYPMIFAALEAALPVMAEPVAWRWHHGDGWTLTCVQPDRQLDKWQPLYASPVAPAAAVKGLTIADLCSDCPPVGYPTDKTRCEPCPRRSALSQPTDAGWRPPEGWRLVPEEPTDEMLVGGEIAVPALSSFAPKEQSPSYIAYRAMLEAAPVLPSPLGGKDV